VSAAGGGGLDLDLAPRGTQPATMEEINYVSFCTFALFLVVDLIDFAAHP